MSKYLIIFEDDKAENFSPLTLIRPVYLLRPGIRYLYESMVDSFPGYTPHLFCRPEIAGIVSDYVNYPVNSFDVNDAEEIIFINGRLKINHEFAEASTRAGESVFLYSGDNIAALKSVGKLSPEEFQLLHEGNLDGFVEKFKIRAQSMNVDIPLYNYLWDLVNDIDRAIAGDFEYFRNQPDASGFLGSREEMRRQGREFSGVEFLKTEEIYISRDAEILPGAVLDARKGPIFIGGRVEIEPHTHIIGPVYVGKDSRLVGGKITGASIGPVCRVGGEVEQTIIQGFTNKYHAGFLGHAYVGEWVNFGAMTTNSDLKNNYTDITVSVNGELINTGSIKVGSFVGDFTKTAIGTMLNTGINIGISCNIVPDGLVTEKEIPSFTWYSPRRKMKYSLSKAIGTIKRSMARRDLRLTEALSNRLEEISRKTGE